MITSLNSELGLLKDLKLNNKYTTYIYNTNSVDYKDYETNIT